jgi:hypothetical protein
MLGVTSETALLADPVFPDRFVDTYTELICVSYEGHSEQQGFVREFLKPALVRKLRVSKAELFEALRFLIDQRVDSELLGKPFQLAEGCGSFQQVDEMGLDPALGKESQRFTGICTFLDTEDLNLQTFSSLCHARYGVSIR